jgi:hypothetical protein
MVERIAVLAALVFSVAASSAAAPDSMKPLRSLVGAWTGQLSCKSGNYGAGANLFESSGALIVSYNSASGGAAPQKAAGRVEVHPRPKPGEFIAVSAGVSVKVTLSEKGQVLLFEPDPAATGLAALVQFSGTARLDKKRTKGALRFTVTSPLGSDPCLGTMTKSTQKTP